MFSAEDAMRQATMTAHEYLIKAITSVDDLLGPGYAKAHPELVGALVQAAATDFDSWARLEAARIANEGRRDAARMTKDD